MSQQVSTEYEVQVIQYRVQGTKYGEKTKEKKKHINGLTSSKQMLGVSCQMLDKSIIYFTEIWDPASSIYSVLCTLYFVH